MEFKIKTKLPKVFGLLVIAALSLMAFASNAAAVTVTSPSGTEYTGEWKASATETVTIKASVFTSTCTESSASGKVEVNTTTAKGKVSSLTFSSCDSVVKTLSNGELEANEAGEIFAKGNEVTIEKIGVSCIYGGGTGTKVGTLTGGTTATATVSASLPKWPGSSSLCASNASLTGKYKVTTPDTLLVK